MPFTKSEPGVPADFYRVEAAGLRWLGEAGDGVPVAQVLEVTDTFARAAEAAGALDPQAADDVRAVCERLRAGDPALTGPEVAPARLHGDLWSGNVLWTTTGPRLIDPAAHGGHPETDLAMLTLFGLPYLDDALAAYRATSPLPPGWEHRAGLHQLHPLLVHAVLFGVAYGAQAGQVARRYR